MKNPSLAQIKKFQDRSQRALRALRLAKKARKAGDRQSMRSWAQSFVTWQKLIRYAAEDLSFSR